MTEHENIPPGEARTQQDQADEPAPIDRGKLYELVDTLRGAADSGEASPALAREAADAIRLLLDAGRRPPVRRKRPRRRPRELDGEGLERLRLLNQKLMEVEQWVRERSAQAVADYFKAGGVERLWDDRDMHLADYEIDAELTFILREGHPDCREDDDNIVAELHWLGSLRHEEPVDDIYTYNWNPYQYQAGHPLEHDHYCWLFHDLTDHALHCDWDKVLAIGGVWIDVTLTQQRGIYW